MNGSAICFATVLFLIGLSSCSSVDDADGCEGLLRDDRILRFTEALCPLDSLVVIVDGSACMTYRVERLVFVNTDRIRVRATVLEDGNGAPVEQEVSTRELVHPNSAADGLTFEQVLRYGLQLGRPVDDPSKATITLVHQHDTVSLEIRGLDPLMRFLERWMRVTQRQFNGEGPYQAIVPPDGPEATLFP